jgi:hypothetical protein
MKKIILLFTMLGVIFSGTTAFAATPKVYSQKAPTKAELIAQIAEQQAIHDKYVALSVLYITKINEGAGKITFQELLDLDAKHTECQRKFNEAIDRWLKLKQQLFNLENGIK